MSRKHIINNFILQSVHLLYKYTTRINFCFIRSLRINFWSLRIKFNSENCGINIEYSYLLHQIFATIDHHCMNVIYFSNNCLISKCKGPFLNTFVLDRQNKLQPQYTRPTMKNKRRHAGNSRWDLTAKHVTHLTLYTSKLNSCLKNISHSYNDDPFLTFLHLVLWYSIQHNYIHTYDVFTAALPLTLVMTSVSNEVIMNLNWICRLLSYLPHYIA
jgi:hypothetical protein